MTATFPSEKTNGAAATAAAPALPEWAQTALNGSSMRVAQPWPLVELEPGDFLAGAVTGRSGNTLTIAVEAGALAGQPLELGEWRRVQLTGVLKTWCKRDEPLAGEKVVVEYRGRIGQGGRPAFDFACGVFREPPPAPWE